jgi:polysaccharide pyruvyl transferase WcaK-like protein
MVAGVFNNMKIGIWGSYNYGNYGDDVMAILFANIIKKEGHTPIVYRLDDRIASNYNISTTNSLDDVVRDSAFVLIGGGGMLVSTSRLKSLLSNTDKKFENDFQCLSTVVNEHNKALVAVSIGGDGSGFDTYLSRKREAVFVSNNFEQATVRLNEDLRVLDRYRIKGEFYPDIVLRACDLISDEKLETKSNNTKIRIGLNLTGKPGRKLAETIVKISKMKNMELYFINSHLREYGLNYEYMHDGHEDYINNYYYDNPEGLLNLIGSIDLLISSKLHLGVSALSMGVPFLSFNGKKKTKEFLMQHNLQQYYFDVSETEKIVEILKDIPGYLNANPFPKNNIIDLKERSQNHFIFLKNMINKYC